MSVCPRCGERNPERARFCMMCASPLGVLSETPESRRIVTVLFADLKGSTKIGERLDPEAVRAVLFRFYAAAREVLERHGGTVEKFIGDAVMAVFGVPHIHEDDARRAVLAAAALQAELGRMNDELLRAKYGVGLELRIGVNTGEVVASDPSTGSSFVAGDAVNVGARFEQAAPPGGVLLGVETFRQVSELIEAEEVEPLTLKGKSEPVPAYLLVAIKEELGSATHSWPMVGRERESGLLDSSLEAAVADRVCHRVVISGPPGIGKTRLAQEALGRWKDRAELLSTRCAPEGEKDPHAAIAELASTALGVEASPDEEAVRRAVESSMRGHERRPVVASALARGMAGGEGGSADEFVWALVELIGVRAGSRPVVILVDDGQWMDPELREVLDQIASRIESPILQLFATLPESDPTTESDATTDGGVAANTVRVDLPPLDEQTAGQILEAVLGGPVDRAARSQVLDAAEGNPFFLIETARMLVDERHLEQRDGVWVPRGTAADMPIPGSIVGLLAARLDRLSASELRLLEAASVIGQAFEVDAAASLLADAASADASFPAAALKDRRMLIDAGIPGKDMLAFAHPLLREVVYGSLTKERRAGLHERYADRCEKTGEASSAVIGTHLERAVTLRLELGAAGSEESDLARRAVEALSDAGDASIRAGNRQAATGFFERVRRLAEAAPLAGDAIAARSRAGHLALELGEWNSARSMLEPLADAGDMTAAKELGQSLAQLARRTSDESDLMRARGLLSMAMEQGSDPDAASSLAGTWKGIDDAGALRLYRRVLELDPSNPYALGNVLEYEVIDTADLAPIEAMRATIDGAAARCREQIERSENIPWAAYDLAKFSILLGDADSAFLASCLAVDRSSAAFMIETSLKSLEGMKPLADRLPGLGRDALLLRLGLAAVFGDAEALGRTREAATPEVAPLVTPVVILAGGSAVEAHEQVVGFGELLRDALDGASGTLISGGTAQGVSALAGDLAEASGGSLRAFGYLPRILPSDVPEEALGERYAELRRTSGDTFSVLEPLRYWADLISQGCAPSDVRLLAIGGGRISEAEYRMALALGAEVGVIRGSGGAAAELLLDPWWATSTQLTELPAEADPVRDFLRG